MNGSHGRIVELRIRQRNVAAVGEEETEWTDGIPFSSPDHHGMDRNEESRVPKSNGRQLGKKSPIGLEPAAHPFHWSSVSRLSFSEFLARLRFPEWPRRFIPSIPGKASSSLSRESFNF